jgi:hypothetical protein
MAIVYFIFLAGIAFGNGAMPTPIQRTPFKVGPIEVLQVNCFEQGAQKSIITITKPSFLATTDVMVQTVSSAGGFFSNVMSGSEVMGMVGIEDGLNLEPKIDNSFEINLTVDQSQSLSALNGTLHDLKSDKIIPLNCSY